MDLGRTRTDPTVFLLRHRFFERHRERRRGRRVGAWIVVKKMTPPMSSSSRCTEQLYDGGRRIEEDRLDGVAEDDGVRLSRQQCCRQLQQGQANNNRRRSHQALKALSTRLKT